ncbi:hypothetical protein AB0M46_18210 [Dactylosporangium sp. NPDC051485]|uniref:hypothetical protein n=1 Tax=Dactylosporangium sp. NPDC051485 TaxID=3154846 RepID=UPI003419A3C3
MRLHPCVVRPSAVSTAPAEEVLDDHPLDLHRQRLDVGGASRWLSAQIATSTASGPASKLMLRTASRTSTLRVQLIVLGRGSVVGEGAPVVQDDVCSTAAGAASARPCRYPNSAKQTSAAREFRPATEPSSIVMP